MTPAREPPETQSETPPGGGARADKGDRDARLAAALRANLGRRKAQGRARAAGDPAGEGPEDAGGSNQEQ